MSAAFFAATATAPCPPPVDPKAAREAVRENLHGAHAHAAGHGQHAAQQERAEPDAGITAPCRCGCQQDSSRPSRGGRLGFALERAPHAPHQPIFLAAAPSGAPLAGSPPCFGIDPIPI